MRCKVPRLVSSRAVWLVLLCALLLQSIFPAAARPVFAGSDGIACTSDTRAPESSGGQHDPRHDLCCTLACAAFCTILAALSSGPFVFPPRRPAKVGLAEDQLATPPAPLELYFAARGPPLSDPFVSSPSLAPL
jgi:hypothetical protein